MLGKTLGHYQVLEKLGAGGMGEVYRARDTRLSRDVAIKVLPPIFAQDRERLARFEREAQLLAALNHPNIAAIYGLEESEGQRFLVLEYVPGETLAAGIAAGPMPVDEAVTIAGQIIDALEEAHEKGILHRDLKPANIKITPEGKVKVLDFGLAKALAAEPSSEAASNSPTLTAAALTRCGALMGTAAYMSPEQARARGTDKRTDIWAFGCVLYEMLSSRSAFAADSISDTLAAILRNEPDWNLLPVSTPSQVRALLGRCLQKDPRQRLRDIGDARMLLHEPVATAVALGSPARNAAVPWLLAGALAVIAAIAFWRPWQRPAPPPRVTRFSVTLPRTDWLNSELRRNVALSPDGTRLVYVAGRGDRTELYLRTLDQFDAKPMPGTEGGSEPFFSPDGESIGFFAGQKLKGISLRGGAPVILCEAPFGYGATWGPDDTILFSARYAGGLSRISVARAGSGVPAVPAVRPEPEALTTPQAAKGEGGHYWPVYLPGGRAALFNVWTQSNPDEWRLAVLNLDTKETRTLIEGGAGAAYSPTGHLIYVRTGVLLAAPFDLQRLAVTGRPFPVLQGVMVSGVGAAQFSVSPQGSLAYVPGGTSGPEFLLVAVGRGGAAKPVTQTRRNYVVPNVSPDGRRVAVSIREGANVDIWVYDLTRDTLTRLTFEPGVEGTPVWSPDGKHLAFLSDRGGPYNLFWKPVDGSAPDERLTNSPNAQFPTSFSPDGKWLALEESHPTTSGDIWVLPMEGDRKLRPVLQTPFNERSAKFSRDGRWLAYTTDESGTTQVYVQAFPGPGGKWQISTDGGYDPVWARNGRELFYRNGDKMMAVDVTTAPAFSAGKPRVLFEGQYRSIAPLGSYDATPDGGFIMIRGAEQQAASLQVNVVLNWSEELKRLAAAATK